MHALKRVARVIGMVARFVVQHKRLALAVAVAALLVLPLALTRNLEVFVLNALGLGIAALIARRVVRIGRGRQTARYSRQRSSQKGE